MKLISHICFSALIAFFIGVSITQFMQSNLAFEAMRPVAETRANWAGQKDLFTQDAAGKDVIVIGDKDFVEKIRAKLDNKFSVYQFSSYEGAINTLAEAYIVAKPNDFKYVVMQNRPFYWTNYWATPVSTYGNFGDNRLWNMSKQDKIISRKAVRLFFDMLELRSMKLLPEPTVKHPESMAYVSWSDWPSDSHFYLTSMQGKIRPDKTFWVRDVSDLPSDLPADILPKFKIRFGGVGTASKNVPGIGISLDADDLVKALEAI